MKEKTLNAKILVEFTISNIISQEDFEKDYKNNMRKVVTQMDVNDGILSWTDDDYKIVSVEVV
jgi:hypothetical protein